MGKIRKADESQALSSLRDLIGKLREQAEQGQIDGSLLDQAGAILDVSVDSAPSTPPEPPQAAQDTASDFGASEVESPEPAPAPAPVAEAPSKKNMPSMPSMATPSTPSTPSAPSMAKADDDDDSEPVSESDEVDADESTDYGGHEVDSDVKAPSAPTYSSNRPSAPKGMNGDLSTVTKKAMPMSGRPPIKQFTAPNLVFDQSEDLRMHLPEFIKALEGGSVKRAQEVAGHNQVAFDALFNMAMHATLTDGGWTTQNMSKLAGMATQDITTADGLAKAVTASSVPGIYLIKLAKLMLPVYAGLVNRLPSQSPQGMSSNQATWRAQLGFGSINEAGGFRTAEAAIGVVPPTNFLTFNAPFSDISYNDSVTLKAIAAGRGYSDPLQISVIKTMAALLRLQERIVLGSNYAAIPAIGTITAGSSATGTLSGSYVVGISALTYEGWLAGSKGGVNAIGEGAAAYASLTSTTAGITATWAAVPGAVAYNVFLTASGSAPVNTSGSWVKTVLVNKAVITAAATGTTGPIAADTTVNTTGQEGILQWCEQSTIYSNSIPSKVTPVDNSAGGLTAANGGISQFDQVLASQWSNWHVAPSVMIMSPNMNATLVGKLMSLNNSSLYRIEVSQERGTIAGGAMVTGYVNKFAPFADGTPRYVDVIPHPYMPDGTVLFLCETIPYPMGNETRGFVRDTLLPYTYFPLASTTVQYNYALTTSEVTECFNPSPQTAIQGVDYTL